MWKNSEKKEFVQDYEEIASLLNNYEVFRRLS